MRWLLLLLGGVGCSQICLEDPDCAEGRVCQEGRCVIEQELFVHQDLTDGRDAPVGSGAVYGLSRVELGGPSTGFDLDGWCPGGNCIDNRFGELANFAAVGSLGRTLVEIAGVDRPFLGDDLRITLKTYEAIDLTDPPDLTDDFDLSRGTCCRFYVSERSVLDDAGDRARWSVPGLYERGRARHAGLGTLAIVVPLRIPALVELHRPAFDVFDTPDGNRAITIILGGVIKARDLYRTPNPECLGDLNTFCRAFDQSLLDLMVDRVGPPDIDLDGDGLETFEFDATRGRISGCFDGCVEGCPQPLPVAPSLAGEPWSCAGRDEIDDGYSVAFVLEGTPSTILGVR